MKRILYITLMTLLMIGSSKLSAGTYSGGTGVGATPYIIATAADLIELSNTPTDWSKDFIQTADIVFNSNPALQDWDGDGSPGPAEGFKPIGNGGSVGIDFDGQNYTISNLYINRSTTDYVGLFSKLNMGYTGIWNIHLVNVNITGHNYVGALIGENGNSTVRCCSSSGSVTGSTYVGGLIGISYAGLVQWCSSSANVTGTGASSEGGVGGLFGRYSCSTAVSDCYATGNATGFKSVGGFAGYLGHTTAEPVTARCYATGNVSGTESVGGFVGEARSNYGSIRCCFSTGNASGTDKVGGFVGYHNVFTYNNRIEDCYSLGNVTRSSGTNTSFGGFNGTIRASDILRCYSIGKVYQSPGILWTSGGKNQGFIGAVIIVEAMTMILQCNYFDKEASQQTAGLGASEKTTAEMKTQSTYSSCSGGWGFGSGSENWVMSSPIAYAGYPTFNYTGGYSAAPSGNQIATLANLVWVAEDATRWSSSYTQTANLDAWATPSWNMNKGWKPIGKSSSCFTGNYDGQGNFIKGLFINRPTNDSVGLFARLSGGSISDLGLLNANITGNNFVGGLVGYNQSNTISSCFSTGTISGNNNTGGFVGKNETGTLDNCYSMANVMRASGINTNFGAFCGDNSGTVQYCYSTGYVNFGTDQGFIGTASGGTQTNNFFDQEVSGQNIGTGATAKTTAEMKTQATFTGWNFTPSTGIWGILGSGYTSYPYLSTISYDITGNCSGENPYPGKVIAPAATTYALTYDANGGAGNVPVDASSPYEAASTVAVLGNVGTPTPLSKTGHVFGGWNTEAGGTGTTYQAGNTFTMPASAVTLYAIWAPAYTFTYNANGGSGDVPVDANSPYGVGTSVTVLGNVGTPDPLTKTNYTFGGWNTLANGNGTTYQAGGTITMTANDVVLYAIWTADTYTVTYDANTGSGNEPIDASSPYEVGEIATVLGNVGTPDPLTKTNYTFGGWNTQADGYGTTYQAGGTITMTANDVVLYAIWTADTYTVTYDANGGSGNVPTDANSPYVVGGTVTVTGNVGSPALTKQYHTFGGWNTLANGSGTSYQSGNNFNMPDNNVTLYAIWTADTYTLTYDANGGAGNVPVDLSSPYVVGAGATVLGNVGTPTTLSKTDFNFGGWNTLANGTGTTYQAGGTVTMTANNLVLYAIWNPNSNPVTYHANGGTGTVPEDANSPYTPGTNVTVLGNTGSPVLAKQYHTFGGWNTLANGSGTSYQPADVFSMPSSSVTLYALWIPDTYTLTYDANGGSGNVPVDATSPYAVGATVTVTGNVGSPALTKQYHTFGGWNTTANGIGTTYLAGHSFEMPAYNMVLYAIWTADTYTVTYDANGGTGVEPIDASSPYVVGATVTVLGNTGSPALTKQYHTFGGWNTADDGSGTAYSSGDDFNMPDNNVTLYAVWTADTYTLTYDANGGSGNVPIDANSPYVVGGTATVTGNVGSPALTKQYHTFGGWNTQANGGGTTYQAGNNFNMPDNNVTLYAIWTADTYTVTYDANGGTGNGPVDASSPYAVGVSVTVLGNVGTPVMTRLYHTFGGWNTQADGTGTTYQAGNNFNMPDNNVTLYAIWTADTYTLTYDANGGTGNVPVDANSPYEVGESITVLGNTGTPPLSKPYYSFGGWNTQADGNGTSYQPGNNFNMPVGNIVLYAVYNCLPAAEVSVAVRAFTAPNHQVRFKAYPTNGGSSPYYKWYKKNGSTVVVVAEGTNLDEYTATCVKGDEHWVELTSSIPCTSSAVNSLSMCTN